ncbi:succinate dehydrogenase [Paraburkholderia acidisoli]|jgi:fumarate reductase subunit C|uniref:Succinate dehydrogenase n=1 Tax=Paraburkholderia acidisoli TaxID=2571748 RepID=A0A7Z2JIE0_9BURK|nr:succinate dehydrogenase [Paraburkholderia acidisoli]QGZ65093.1 succinate dehydrogenase [Paraburkholderia acidisoli]
MQGLSLRTQARLWYWQRMSATVLALCVFVHLGVILYAVHSGLSAASLLGRTRGNLVFGAFYALFVLACTIHVPVGLLRIAEEWLHWRGKSAQLACLAFSAVLAVMGLRAVYGVVM